jgi:Fe-S cluster biogenesis protein NfuA
MEILEKIQLSLDKVRPSLQADGGDAEIVEWNQDSGILKVRMIGMCSHCPMSQITLKQGIEVEIRKDVPEVKEVVSA